MPAVIVSTVIKERLEAMRQAMIEEKGRKSVNYSEVLERLLAEHDQNVRKEEGA